MLSSASPPDLVVNEELYSRQLYVLGVDAQIKLQTASVLVSGELSGLGAEICKNIVLAGIHALDLHDETLCSELDRTGAGAFLFANATGKQTRSSAALQVLREMNPHVRIRNVSAGDTYSNYQVVVLVNCTRQHIASVCTRMDRSKTRVIVTGMYGVLSYCFCDFGGQWESSDLNGELPRSGLCLRASQSVGENNCLQIETEFPHGLCAGDQVKFSTAREQQQHHEQVYIVSTLRGKTGFQISAKDDVAAPIVSGCYFEQVKPNVLLRSHVDFTQSLVAPRFCANSLEDEQRPQRLFALLMEIWKLLPTTTTTTLPSTEEECLAFVKRLPPGAVDYEEALAIVRTFGLKATSPVASWMGGIAGQEVLKAATGKFTPLDQWLLDCPARASLPLFARLHNSATAQERLAKLRILVVGAGALGCELVKHLALLNACQAQANGLCIVTDPDSIEISNLNRQFLFRASSVGKNKASEAARACAGMNAKFNVQAMDLRVSPESKQVFDDCFWDKIDLVINALDNVPSRVYVDSQCVYYGKPLFESGTLGTKANVLPIIPHLTESYASDQVRDEDAGAEDIPACTLHAYPNLFEHCLTWARDAVFERELTCVPQTVKRFVDNPSAALNAEDARLVRSVLVGMLPGDEPDFPFTYPCLETMRDCLGFAKRKFAQFFTIKIDSLLEQHPEGEEDAEGNRFWSGKRRQAPVPAVLDLTNDFHVRFLTSFAKLVAKAYGITPLEGGLELSSNDGMPSAETGLAEKQVPSLAEDLEALHRHQKEAARGREMAPVQFDKDDDVHVDLIWSAACIRASNYGIPLQTRMESKRVVGRIIPAIATTTAATCGLVALELLKYVLALDEGSNALRLDIFRSHNFNLAINSYAAFEPRPCDANLWNVMELRGDLTVEQFAQALAERLEKEQPKRTGFQLSSVSTSGNITLYNDLLSNQDALLTTKLSVLYQRIVGESPPGVFLPLLIDGEFDDEDEDVNLPAVRLRLK